MKGSTNFPGMILPPIRPYRRRRGRLTPRTPAATMPLTLVLADFDKDGGMLTLAFDEAVVLDDVNPGAFVVDDVSYTDQRWQGTAVHGISPTSFWLEMEPIGPAIQPGVHLTVSSDNGVRSATGASWAGATDLALPVG